MRPLKYKMAKLWLLTYTISPFNETTFTAKDAILNHLAKGNVFEKQRR
jgi:hypothetical protein